MRSEAASGELRNTKPWPNTWRYTTSPVNCRTQNPPRAISRGLTVLLRPPSGGEPQFLDSQVVDIPHQWERLRARWQRCLGSFRLSEPDEKSDEKTCKACKSRCIHIRQAGRDIAELESVSNDRIWRASPPRLRVWRGGAEGRWINGRGQTSTFIRLGNRRRVIRSWLFPCGEWIRSGCLATLLQTPWPCRPIFLSWKREAIHISRVCREVSEGESAG